MSAPPTSTKEFSFELSAFLSSSRSALQYALEDAKKKPGGQAWFDGHAPGPDIKYLKDKRDGNIHIEPVSAQPNITFCDSISVGSLSILSITLTDIHGNVEHGVVSTSAPTEKLGGISPSSASICYRFLDWPGPEDVYTLCERYLLQLEAIVADGLARGFITTA